MFDSLSGRLADVFDRLKRRGALNEVDVDAAMRDVRVALLEADVALPVVKDFVKAVKAQAVGQAVLKSITPGQMVVKIVNDELARLLGGEDPKDSELRLGSSPPQSVLMVGLQGSGKTTTAGKLGRKLSKQDKKKVLLASLDTRRPAAMEQLGLLAEQADVGFLPIVSGQDAVAIARRALDTARREGYDVVILDTAGRNHIDDELMAEARAIKDLARPDETILVCDALTGQDAVNVAREFHGKIGVSGIALTRMDGDARGGAALSMRAITGQPIKLIGVGEKIDALQNFHPERVASRILGMGDVVSLVERVQETVDQDEAEKVARKMAKGAFDLNDYATQLNQMKRMGGMGGVMSLLPGVAKMKKQLDEAQIDESVFKRQAAIISSMTKKERRYPKLLNGSRRRRIASGSGTSVEEVNRLLKQFQQMQAMMKKMKGGGLQKMMKRMPPDMLARMPGGLK